MNVHSCILVRLLHLFVFSKAQTVPQSTRSACRIPVLMQSSLKNESSNDRVSKDDSLKVGVGWCRGLPPFASLLWSIGFPMVGEVKDDDCERASFDS